MDLTKRSSENLRDRFSDDLFICWIGIDITLITLICLVVLSRYGREICCTLFRKESMRAEIMFGVIRAGELFCFNGFAAAWSVDKFAVADVETDVGIFG